MSNIITKDKTSKLETNSKREEDTIAEVTWRSGENKDAITQR